MSTKLASRMGRLGTETAFEVLVRAKALEAQGRDVVHLEIGEPDFDTPQNIVEAGATALREGWTHYGPAAGIPELRGSAILYLVVYNLAFVLPLLVILVLAVYGTSAAKFEAWFVKNVARTKLIMALLFLLLGALLIVQLVTL